MIKVREREMATAHAKIFISQGWEEPQGYLSREYEKLENWALFKKILKELFP